MMRPLILTHRWLGVAFCLLFAMWFATGIVMHFVPFPSLTETERVDGLAPIDTAQVQHPPADAVGASGLGDPRRVRLLQRIGGPVYLVSGASGLKAIRASDLTEAAVHSEPDALALAADHARRRGLDTAQASVAGLADYDQWTVPNRFDVLRPLYRIALNDASGTDVYISSVSGEVVLETTRRARGWNYVGSILHWIYLTPLRSHWSAWDRTVWWISLAGVLNALSGAVIGVARISFSAVRIGTPYRGWQAWHHVLGLLTMGFLLTWIVSGWLSMDHGRLFSQGKPTASEAKIIADAASWISPPIKQQPAISTHAREVEWFVFDRTIYRRERTGPATQVLFVRDTTNRTETSRQAFLQPDDLRPLIDRLAPGCRAPTIVAADDAYPITSSMLNAPVYRSICGPVWFQIDGANGEFLERLDPSRRAYRWVYTALHTMDFPVLLARPGLRSIVVVGLCSFGCLFSITGIVIGWRRLRRQRRTALRAHG